MEAVRACEAARCSDFRHCSSAVPFPAQAHPLKALLLHCPQIKSTINGFLSDQMRAIWNTWLVIQVLLFAFTICAIAAASDTSAWLGGPPCGASA